MHRSDEDKKSLLSRNTTASDAADGRRMSTSLDRNDSLKKKLDQSVKAAEEEWDNIIIALGLTEGSAKDEVISGMGYARSVVISAIKAELVKVNRKFKTYEEQKRRVDEKNIRRALAEYKSLLQRVNADYSVHTGTPLSSLEGVENIAKKEGLDTCLRLLREQRVVVKKTSTLGLTDVIEMVTNPSANPAANLRKKTETRQQRGAKVKKESDDDERFSSKPAAKLKKQSSSRIYTVRFPKGVAMGMSLEERTDGSACVLRVAKDGIASKEGVIVKSVVVGVGTDKFIKKTWEFDDILRRLAKRKHEVVVEFEAPEQPLKAKKDPEAVEINSSEETAQVDLEKGEWHLDARTGIYLNRVNSAGMANALATGGEKVKVKKPSADDDGSSEDQQVDLEKGEFSAASAKTVEMPPSTSSPPHPEDPYDSSDSLDAPLPPLPPPSPSKKVDDDKKPQAVETSPPPTSVQQPGEVPAASTKTKKVEDDKKPQAVETSPPPQSLQPPEPQKEEKEKEEVKYDDTLKDAQTDVGKGPQAMSSAKQQVVEASPPKPPMIKTLSSKPAVSVTTLAKKFENAATI
ncbi:hypothetical protein TrVE_jg6609 [Triparma verrucosa]|uniref:Uncharacterized protein n=1 Tax=Triparma verrucosa TaxID=1606542 RepID=A0A9W7EXT9_9STRA|nr:hypothetical protein TrVE_jg6609 [Triparma verrucosa]